jgi:ABC-type amino acid transport substrate-binding protein
MFLVAENPEILKSKKNRYQKLLLLKPLLFIMLLFFQINLLAAQTNIIQQQVNLTNEELAYIQENKKIKVHNEKSWAPFNFNNDGIPSGFSIDYIRLVASKVGLDIEFVTGEWNELLNLTMNKKNDVMLNIVYTDQRAKNLIYVDNYVENPNVIVGRKNDSSVKGIETLFGKKMAVVAGFFNEDILIKDYPLIQRVVFKNMVEAIKAVQHKEADAVFAGTANINYVMKELFINDLEIKSEFDTNNVENQKLYIATKKDEGILASILKKAMATVSEQQLNELKQKWQINLSNQSKLNLSNEQKNWLKTNTPIKLGSTDNWPPFDMVENGKHTGINADYLTKLKEILGVEIVPIINQEWNSVLSDAKDGKSQGITGLPKASEYEKDFLFTNSYAHNPVVIITKSTSKIKNINDLKTLNTVSGNDFSAELSKEQNSKIKYFNSTLDCFNDILDGKSDGYIGWLADAQYLMTQNAISGLKVSINVPSEQSALRIGVSKQNPQLKEILDIALNQITQDEKNKILNKWISTSNNEHKLQLTVAESKWLQSKPVLKFSVDPNWAPLELINDDKKYEGMNADFLALISELTGIEFKLEPTKEWPESVQLSKENKVDMLACVSKTAEREKYLNFTTKTFELTDGILMRSDAKFIDKIDDLKGVKVGVPDGTSLHKKLLKENPLLILVPIKGNQKALEMLVKGEIDAYAGNLEVSGYLIQQLGFYNLKVIWRLDKDGLV